MISTKVKLHLAFLFFLISALYGLLLRINNFLPSESINHSWLTQGHSHIAFLGWGFLATIALMNRLFLTKNQQKKKIYPLLFIVFLSAIVGMLFSFPLQGYKFFSILFLTIFGLSSYLYCYHFLKDLKQNKNNNIATKYVQWAIYYYLLSSIAIWAIGPILITVGKTALYYNGVYFYLHFLYNGFFVMGLFGILLHFFQSSLIDNLRKKANLFFILTNVACIPAYSLSILWSEVSIIYNYIGFIAGLIQVISLFYLIPLIMKLVSNSQLFKFQKLTIYIIILSYAFKVLAQLASSFPEVVQKSIALKSYLIIGYLHLFTLLFMSLLLLLFIQLYSKLKLNLGGKIAYSLFLIGIFLTELLLFGQGFYIWIFNETIPNFNWYKLLASIVLFTGLCFYYLYQFVFDEK